MAQRSVESGSGLSKKCDDLIILDVMFLFSGLGEITSKLLSKSKSGLSIAIPSTSGEVRPDDIFHYAVMVCSDSIVQSRVYKVVLIHRLIITPVWRLASQIEQIPWGSPVPGRDASEMSANSDRKLSGRHRFEVNLKDGSGDVSNSVLAQ